MTLRRWPFLAGWIVCEILLVCFGSNPIALHVYTAGSVVLLACMLAIKEK